MKPLARAAMPEGFAVCNHTPFETHIGPFFERWDVEADGRRRFTLAVMIEQRHLGFPERSHGGLILTLMDEAMGKGAYRELDAFTYTLSINTDFIGPAPEGSLLEVQAWCTGTTSSYAFMSGRALADGALVATGNGVWVRQRQKYLTPDMNGVLPAAGYPAC